MPAPASVIQRQLKERLKNLSESEKTQVLQEALESLPGYTSGPYGDLRNWIKEQTRQAQTRTKVLHSESFTIRKDGHRQIAIAGPPNSGKSSLLRALTGRQVKVGSYAFTTLKPVAATLNLDGALIQLVEIPGLIKGASQGAGNGKAMLAALRVADAAIITAPLTGTGLDELRVVWQEVREAGQPVSTDHVLFDGDQVELRT